MKNQLSMEDFSHLTEEQLNSLTTGANFLFTVQPQSGQKAPASAKQPRPKGKKKRALEDLGLRRKN